MGGKFSLAQLDKVLGRKRLVLQAVGKSPHSYESFVEALYADIDDGIRNLIHGKNHFLDASEDQISFNLITFLKAKEYDASHDTNVGGNVDLFVRSVCDEYGWIGEAKKYKSVSHAREGYLQLSTRYTTGVGGENQGGLLLYLVDVKHAAKQMQNWQAELTGNRQIVEEDVEIWDCTTQELAFFSRHLHESSGLPFTVRHMPVCLYHRPRDKSARSSQVHTASATS